MTTHDKDKNWSEEIDWWLRATKKDVSAKAARKCAEAIRARGDTK